MTNTRMEDRILREIRSAIDHRRDARPLQQQAIRIFATINDFRVRSMKRYSFDQHKICDHQINLGGAVIGQPYSNALGNDWRQIGEEIAAEHGLAFHTPPIPTASIWVPGSTLFLVFAKPGHAMRWLPEQINGIAGVSHG